MDSTKPNLNVTPLIDILLVLLIIFMVISPLRPSKFETRIPSEPKIDSNAEANPHTLIVKVNTDFTLELNGLKDMGSIDEPKELRVKLASVFSERAKNGVINQKLLNRKNTPLTKRIQKTVFVKAPKTLSYGKVIKVIDAIKRAGANPISLQIDDID